MSGLDVATAVVTLAGAGMAVAKGLIQIADSIGSAGEEVRLCAADTTLFSQMLVSLADGLRNPITALRATQNIMEDLVNVCERILVPFRNLIAKLKPLLDKYCHSRQQLRQISLRIQWVFRHKSKVIFYQQALGQLKATLTCLLASMSLQESRANAPQNTFIFEMQVVRSRAAIEQFTGAEWATLTQPVPDLHADSQPLLPGTNIEEVIETAETEVEGHADGVGTQAVMHRITNVEDVLTADGDVDNDPGHDTAISLRLDMLSLNREVLETSAIALRPAIAPQDPSLNDRALPCSSTQAMTDSGIETVFQALCITESENRLIIGIDFGTTWSSIAYLFTEVEKPNPIVILNWPGNRFLKTPSVPTSIRYDNFKHGSYQWGFEVDPSAVDKIEGIKLLLDPDGSERLFMPQWKTEAELWLHGRSATDVAADYISAIYEHASSEIDAAWPQDFIRQSQKEFVLSVPAVWSDKAKNSLMRAAKKAGISPITLIKEPEAATLYTLHTLRDGALRAGDAFVLCDAGDATVDCISYEIKRSDHLELRELVPGNGCLAGSLSIDKRFEEAIKDAVGEEQYTSLCKSNSYRLAMHNFANSVKLAFNPYEHDEDEMTYFSFPMARLKDDPTKNIIHDCFAVSREALKGVFEPIVAEVSRIIKSQVESVCNKRMKENRLEGKEPKAIFLVGSFGSSVYLREHLQKLHSDIQIINPIDAWTAVVRGAVLSKTPLEAVVTSTIATRHYGVSAAALSHDDDEGQTQLWDPFTKRYRVWKMKWFIFVGQELRRGQVISFPFYRTLNANYTESQLVFKDELIQSEEIEPPKYPSQGLTSTNCVLRVDFREVSRDKFKRCTRKDGRTYYEVHYNLNVTFDSAIMKFTSEMGGEEMGAVEANYE